MIETAGAVFDGPLVIEIPQEIYASLIPWNVGGQATKLAVVSWGDGIQRNWRVLLILDLGLVVLMRQKVGIEVSL